MWYLALALNLLAIVVTVHIVLRDNRTKIVPLFSFRNIFLAGYLYFQAFGLFLWLFNRRGHSWWSYLIVDNNFTTTANYTLLLNLFLVIFLLTYRLLPLKFRQVPLRHPSLAYPHRLMRLSVVMTFIAILVYIAGFFALNALCGLMAAGIGSTAVGLATWAWTRRINQPNYLFLLGIIVLINLTPHLTSFGRRGIVSLAFMIAWVIYYRVSFRFNPVKVAVISVFVGSPILIALAAFSEVRVHRPETPYEAVQLMVNADLRSGFERLATFQGSAVISMWCMEKHPEPHGYRWFHSLRATFHHFIPRAYWPEKPTGLGIMIPKLAGLKRVGGLNVGAGLIGHAAAEGGWPVLIAYAFILGAVLRLLDHLVLTHSSPLYRVPFACALGELFAVSRGEVAFFLDNMFIASFSGFMCLQVLLIFFTSKKVPESPRPLPPKSYRMPDAEQSPSRYITVRDL